MRKNMLRYASGMAGLLAATAVTPSFSNSPPPPPPAADVIIRGGMIYTGESAPFTGDVAISGDRISYVGPHAPGEAGQIIDARGLIVAPGFIDPHSHIDDQLTSSDPDARLVPAFILQGVTTTFIGVDGMGGPDVAATLARASNPLRRVGVNYATFVGFGGVRDAVIGAADRPPTPDEMTRMRGLVAQAMCSGALGLSTGLFYAPQSYAKSDEVVALAREAGQRGGIYDSHIRDESSYSIGLLGAIDEALAVGRDAQLPVHIAHIKALGVDVQGQAPAVIARIDAARAAGQVVHADQYPWSASGTSLAAALMPRWAQDGGRTAMLARLDDPAQRARIRSEMRENLRRRGGAVALLITGGPEAAMGKTLEAIASASQSDPVDAAIAVLREADAWVASFNQSEADIARFMQQPWVVTSSDASIGHPRYYGSFARKYRQYVRETHVITLRQFIESSSRVTADMFGLTDRGRLRSGAFADVIAFDPAEFAERANYASPFLYAKGMRMVAVNGQIVVENGTPTGVAAGRALAHRPTGAACQ